MKNLSLRAALISILFAFFTAGLGALPAQANGYTVSGNSYVQAVSTWSLGNSQTYTAGNFPSNSITWSISPALPAGLTLTGSGSTASITGTPTAGYAPVDHTITAKDSTDATITASKIVQVSVASRINVTSSLTTVLPNTVVATPITVSFSKDSFITSNSGGVTLSVRGLNPATATCNDVTLSATSATCTAQTQGSSISYDWRGIDFTAQSSFTITLAANAFTSADGVGQNSMAGLYVYLANTPGSPPQMNNGSANISVTATPPSPPTPPAPPSTSVSIDLSAAIGDLVAGSAAPFTASGLQAGSTYDVTVRSTPQIIAEGVVPQGGTISGTAVIPAGLAPGLHSITFRSVAADGTETKDVVWFEISADGTLLSKSNTEPARLAQTPAPPAQDWFWAVFVLIAGLGAFIYGREFNPEFLRVMSLVRKDDGEFEWVKRRIRSEEF